MEYISLLMFLAVCLVLLLGYPVAYSLAGTALIFAGVGALFGVFDTSYLQAVPSSQYVPNAPNLLHRVPPKTCLRT